MPCTITEGEAAAWTNWCAAVAMFNYVSDALGSPRRINARHSHFVGEPPPWEEGGKYIFTADVYVMLCEMLKPLDPARRDEIIYNARNADARSLANWWEYHEQQDREREQREADEAERSRLRAEAAKKLTPAERAALGLKD